MSEIPFYFHPPAPRYFRDKGFFKNQKNLAFVTWCFERCSMETREIEHDNQLIKLLPYQFIFGRIICSEESGLSEDEVRTQQKRWENHGFLKKAPNKTPSRFTIYEWVLTSFLKNDPQVNPQATPKSPPSHPHNQDTKNTRSKESLHPYPSSEIVPQQTDDFFQIGKEEGKKAKTELATSDNCCKDFFKNDNFPEVLKKNTNIQLIIPVNGVNKTVTLSPQDYAACLKIKGSKEAVEAAIEYVLRSPGRKHKITNWPNTLATWDIKTNFKPMVSENEEIAVRLSQTYDSFEKGNGHTCRIYVDKQKDQRGLLFEPQSPYLQPTFIALVDAEFRNKACKYIRDNKMQKSRAAAIS